MLHFLQSVELLIRIEKNMVALYMIFYGPLTIKCHKYKKNLNRIACVTLHGFNVATIKNIPMSAKFLRFN